MNYLMPECSLVPKSYSLFPYFCSTRPIEFNPYLPFKFLIFYHSSLFAFYIRTTKFTHSYTYFTRCTHAITQFETVHSMFTHYDTVHTHFDIVHTHFGTVHTLFTCYDTVHTL